MINISNDAWFKDSAGPYQHLMCQVFRAVENRISIVRVANTGISCVIDPFGRIVKRVGEDEDQYLNITGVASEDIQINPGPTFYTRYGDIFVIGCTAMLILYLVWRLAGYIFALISGKEKECSA
jgi:apolipoprotein N-acyltransferase